MFELIIIIVVIAAFVFSRASRKKAAGNTGGKGSGQGKNDSAVSAGAQSSYTKQAKPNRPKPGTKTAKPNQPKPGTAKAKPNQSTEKEKQARYPAYKKVRQSGQSVPAAGKQVHADDILESARENTRAVQIDNDMDTIEIGDLMKKVQDNIVMGPDDTLTFQRDFVAEGMDFLNRCMTVPETEAQA